MICNVCAIAKASEANTCGPSPLSITPLKAKLRPKPTSLAASESAAVPTFSLVVFFFFYLLSQTTLARNSFAERRLYQSHQNKSAGVPLEVRTIQVHEEIANLSEDEDMKEDVAKATEDETVY
eukprot:Em0007g427a